jgi:hypothetical protein
MSTTVFVSHRSTVPKEMRASRWPKTPYKEERSVALSALVWVLC